MSAAYITDLVISRILGLLFVILVTLLPKRTACPECKMVMPRVRIPINLHQLLWGGWICPNCGCKMDRKGKMLRG